MQLKWCFTRPNSAPAVFLLGILLMVGGAVSAQEVRVHVLPAVNRTGEAQFDAVASTVTGTVSLTLRLLDRYSITEGVPAGFGGRLPLPESAAGRSGLLVEMAESIPAENIVFGEVVSTASGSEETEGDLPELVLYVYDRLQERVVLTERRQPDTLFDIFVATDELSAALLTSFSGRRVTFGSLRIVPTIAGSDEAPRAAAPDYVVTLDGQTLGQNLRSIDSILTGEHTLTVTAEISGERRTLYDEEITVREGGSTRVALLLPNVAVLEAEAADEEAARQTAAEEAQQRLAAALEALAEERRNNQYALAEEYYLRADEFIDPVAIREAARENAAQAAELEISRGQRLLSEREWEAGVASHRLVAELGQTFDSEDLFGVRQEVGFVAEAWREEQARVNRKPFPFVHFGVLGWASFWLAATGAEELRIGTSDLQNQNVFALPMLFGAGFLGLWNATDWNLRRPNRVLQRYGETGGVPGGSFKRWNPKRWQVGIGATSSFGGTGSYLEVPESIGDVGAKAFRYNTQVILAPTIHGRYWFSPSHGAELRYRVTPLAELTGWRRGIWLVADPGELADHTMPFNTYLSISTPIDLSLSWLYTRSGRSNIDLGITYREDILHADSLKFEEEQASPEGFSEQEIGEAYDRLAGREEIIRVPGLRIGYAYRFGRLSSLPWEFRLGYQLDHVRFPVGVLSEQGTYFVHSASLTLSRFFGFGETTRSEGTRPGGVDPFGAARRQTETRWDPLPLSVFFDPGGIIGSGWRFGLEIPVLDSWTVSVWGRQFLSFLSYHIAQNTTTQTDSNRFIPGVGARWYSDRNGSTLQSAAALRGWYVGALFELLLWGDRSFMVPEEEVVNPANPPVETEGWIVMPQMEGGYRFGLWRSAFLDVGVQAGYATGTGLYARELEFEPDGTSTEQAEGEFNNLLWGSLVLSLGTALY